MPELTPADTRFLVLSKLNLSNKEMAGILVCATDTIRSYKHRLRRRFDLPEDANIKLFCRLHLISISINYFISLFIIRCANLT